MTDQPLPRIKAADVTPATQSIFQQHWEARTTDQLQDCLHPLYFNPVNARLKAGDRISLCQFAGPDFAELVAFVGLRVINVEDGRVYLIPESEIIPCELAYKLAMVTEPVPVSIKKVFGAHQIVGLDQWGVFPEFPSRQECVEWIERNAKSVYLDSSKAA